ncbi:TIGR02391 family protein [Rhodococcus sp. G-MC3]|uniref:TIGR02391 family protein n=1 Tax=Rhodococcus sp. G-MC3 TaxID=3046209 RepID=UPI0030152F8F
MTSPSLKRLPVFDPQLTEAVSNILAQTDYPGLTGTDIDTLLQLVNVTDQEPGPNKRTRLYLTLHNTQVSQGCGNVLGGFVARAMRPSRYVTDQRRWMQLRDQLNAVLVLYGYKINEEGRLSTGAKASTLTEAARLAGELQTELHRRGCHAELFKYCAEEVIVKDLFHAMSEASKSAPNRVRALTGLTTDGQELYDAAFGTNTLAPIVFINAYRTASEISEHKGFKNLLIGVHGHYRNPRAHKTREGTEELLADFYDLFALISYVHRRLDESRRT